jgi:hypothetical protein
MEGNGRPAAGSVERVEIGVVAEISGADAPVEVVVEEVVVEEVVVDLVEEGREPAAGAATAAAELVIAATRLGFGLAELAGVTARAIVERFGATLDAGSPPPPPAPRPPGVLPDALVGLVLSAERRLRDAAERADARLGPAVTFLATRTPARYPVGWVRSWVTGYAERGAAEQAENRLAISTLVGAMVPEVVGAVLEEVDVAAIAAGVDIDGVVATVDLDRVLDRVDVSRVLDRIDLDAVVARVDINQIAERIDLDAIVGRVDLGAVVERLDIQAIVDRLDLDALAARIDMNAVVNRLDLPTITEQVMEEVDIGEIIRESTGTIGTGAVDSLRYSGMSMDRFVGRVVDRVLFRRGGRTLAPDATGEAPALVPAVPGPADEGDATGP